MHERMLRGRGDGDTSSGRAVTGEGHRARAMTRGAACLLCLSLSACVEPMPVVIEPFPYTLPPAGAPALPADPGPLVIDQPPPGALGELGGLPDPAVATCMTAVAEQAGNPLVAPSQVVPGGSGTTVLLGVGEERAPWECRVDQTGAVVAVTSLLD